MNPRLNINPEDVVVSSHGTTLLGSHLIQTRQVNDIDTYPVYMNSQVGDLKRILERNLIFANRNSHGRATLENPPAIVLVRGLIGSAYHLPQQAFFDSIGLINHFGQYSREFGMEELWGSYADFSPEKGGAVNHIGKLATWLYGPDTSEYISVIRPDEEDIPRLLQREIDLDVIEKYSQRMSEQIESLLQ